MRAIRSWLLVLIAAQVSAAEAAVVVDQQNTPTVGHVIQARSPDFQGQTFTVGLDGQLTAIKVDVADYNVPPVDVQFYLAPIESGVALFSQAYHITVPSSEISTAGTGSGPAQDEWLNLNFTPLDVQVKAGQQYALVFGSPITFDQTGGPNAEQINWFFSVDDTYGGGHYVEFASLSDLPVPPVTIYVPPWPDAEFITYVSPVPEPATWAMFIVGFGAIGGLLRLNRSAQGPLRAT